MDNYFESILNPEDRGKLQPCKTVPEFLTLIEQYDKRIAFVEGKTQTNYTVFCHGVGQLRGVLAQQSFQKGDTIAILMPNSTLAAQAFLAVASFGCKALLLPAAMQGPALAGTAKKFDIKGIFCAESLRDAAKQTLPDMLFLETEYAKYPYAPRAMIHPEDPAAIFLTGGTTGTPKGAVLSHQALLRGAYNGALVPNGVFNHTTYAILPFCHVFGMIRGILSFLQTGSKICVCSSMKAIFTELPAYQPDTLILVPGLAQLLLQVMQMKGALAHGGRLKTIISGAAMVPQHLIAGFQEYGVAMMPGYGLTETANLVSGNVHPFEKPGSVGKPYPGQVVEIHDGEIWVRGDNLMSEYYNDPQETDAAFANGWLRTGDLGHFDDDGFLYITGRIKNLIILSNGENVAPEEIEALLYEHKAVKDCLVKEMDGQIGVELQLRADLFSQAETGELEQEAKQLVKAVNAQLPDYKQIRRVVLREKDFEKTGSMKVKRT